MASSLESEQYTHSRISNCPEYYRLADGRPFWLFSATDLTALLWSHGIVGWPYHCAISALEHLFRMGVKEGETETDMESFQWWWHDVPDTLGRRKAYDLVIIERRKLGR
jgi:hypothetical protein